LRRICQEEASVSFLMGLLQTPLTCALAYHRGPAWVLSEALRIIRLPEGHLPEAHCFADDTQPYLSFKPDSATDQAEAVHAMENCIDDLRKWMFQDKLKLMTIRLDF